MAIAASGGVLAGRVEPLAGRDDLVVLGRSREIVDGSDGRQLRPSTWTRAG